MCSSSRFLLAFRVVLTLMVFSSCIHNVYSDETMRVITTGDSITTGYSPRLGASFNDISMNISVVGVASGGLNSSQYIGETRNWYNSQLRDYTSDVITADPDAIFFMLGTNDVYPDSNATQRFEDYKTRLSGVFERFKTATNTSGAHPLVIVSTVIPILIEGKDAANQRIDDWYNPWLKSSANEYGFELLDLNTNIKQQENWHSFYSDGIHLWANDAVGYDWMADQFANTVAELTLLEGDGVVKAPEPATLSLLGIGGLVMLKRKRK